MHRDDIQRVAVFRALQLGDTLCAIPALRAIRAAWPDARVSLIGLPWARQLLARYGDLVDELVEFPGFPGITERHFEAAALPGFFAEMQARHFDLAVQLHGNGRASNAFVALLGARRSIGSYAAGSWRPGPGYIAHDERLAEVERLLSVVEAAGMSVSSRRPDFPLLPADAAELAAVVPDLAPGGYACLHPGARDPRRRWDPARFAAVADWLARRGMRPLLTGTADDAPLHRAVQDVSTARLESVAGRLSLGGLGQLLAGASLVVSNDTGVSHLSAAVGAPTLTIHVASDPARWAPAGGASVALGGPAAVRAGCCAGEGCERHRPTWSDVPAEAAIAAAERTLTLGVRDAA